MTAIHVPLVQLSRTTFNKRAPAKPVSLTIDGKPVSVPEGTTILAACREIGVEIPTLCFLETLTPVNACRVCVVELEGARTLVPACARPVEPQMVVKTNSERVRHSRRLVLELLASSVDLSLASGEIRVAMEARQDADRGQATSKPAPPPPTTSSATNVDE